MGMSERKYVVPEGMLKAATAGRMAVVDSFLREMGQTAFNFTLANMPSVETDRAIVEAAMLWLISQNPDVGESAEVGTWLRRTFLAPEPEIRTFVKKLADGYRGVTLTPQEADFIVEQLRYVAHGWDGGAK